MTDGEVGMLTPADRRYLRENPEYVAEHTRQAANKRERSVRNRVSTTVDDLALLADNIEEIDGRLSSISVEEWDRALSAIRTLHPDPPEHLDSDMLRSIAQELQAKADRLDKITGAEK